MRGQRLASRAGVLAMVLVAIAAVTAAAVATTGDGNRPPRASAVDERRLPLGDRRYSNRPRKGYVVLVITSFNTATLDACHGHTHRISWNGRCKRLYHYHATLDFPYVVSCYRGRPITEATGLGIGGGDGAPPMPPGPPPLS